MDAAVVIALALTLVAVFLIYASCDHSLKRKVLVVPPPARGAVPDASGPRSIHKSPVRQYARKTPSFPASPQVTGLRETAISKQKPIIPSGGSYRPVASPESTKLVDTRRSTVKRSTAPPQTTSFPSTIVAKEHAEYWKLRSPRTKDDLSGYKGPKVTATPVPKMVRAPSVPDLDEKPKDEVQFTLPKPPSFSLPKPPGSKSEDSSDSKAKE